MSILNPDKYDDLYSNIEVISDILSNPLVRENEESVKMYVEALNLNIKLLMEITNGKI